MSGDNILPPDSLFPFTLTPLLGPDVNSSFSHPAGRPHHRSHFCAHRCMSSHRQLKSAQLPQVCGPPTFPMAVHVAPHSSTTMLMLTASDTKHSNRPSCPRLFGPGTCPSTASSLGLPRPPLWSPYKALLQHIMRAVCTSELFLTSEAKSLESRPGSLPAAQHSKFSFKASRVERVMSKLS